MFICLLFSGEFAAIGKETSVVTWCVPAPPASLVSSNVNVCTDKNGIFCRPNQDLNSFLWSYLFKVRQSLNHTAVDDNLIKSILYKKGGRELFPTTFLLVGKLFVIITGTDIFKIGFCCRSSYG